MPPRHQVSSNARGVSSGGMSSRLKRSKPSHGRASGSYGLTDRTTIDAHIAFSTDASSGPKGAVLLSLSVVALSIRPKYGRDLCVRYPGMARALRHRSENRAGLRELVFSRYLEPARVLQWINDASAGAFFHIYRGPEFRPRGFLRPEWSGCVTTIISDR